MKKIFKKNQIIITALALMIAVAGYLQYTGKGMGDEDVLQQTNTQLSEDTYEISEEDIFNAEDIFTDTEENEVDNPGEAVLTSSETQNMDFAAEVKLNREQIRSKNREILQEVIDNQNITQEQKQEALDAMVELTDIAEREAAAEMLLEAKGFTEVVVSVHEDTADVVLFMGEVTDAKLAQVEDIVKRKTGVGAENIVITPIESAEETVEETSQEVTEDTIDTTVDTTTDAAEDVIEIE